MMDEITKETSIKMTIFSAVVVMLLLFVPYLSGNRSLNLDNPYYATAFIALICVILVSLGMLLSHKRSDSS